MTSAAQGTAAQTKAALIGVGICSVKLLKSNFYIKLHIRNVKSFCALTEK